MDLDSYNYAVENLYEKFVKKEVSKFKPNDVSKSLKRIVNKDSLKGLRDYRKK